VPRDWYRVHRVAHEPIYFSKTDEYRFNAPSGEYGVTYVSTREQGAFAETFLRARRRPPIVSEAALEERAITRIRWSRSLKLADFAGPGLVALGLDNRINDGDCYPLAQRWSHWVWSHPDRFDGILYVPRNAPHTRSAVIFEGRAKVKKLTRLASPLTSPRYSTTLGAILDEFNVALIGS
jgi:hypothetical protein